MAARVQESPNIALQQKVQDNPAQPLTWEKVYQVFLYVVDCLKACFCGREMTFYSACEKGHTYTVQKWMKQVDLENHGKDFFYTAARASQTGILSLLKNNGVDAKASFIDALFKHNFKACNTLLPFLSLEELQAIEETLREKYQTTIMKEIALDYHPHAKELVQALSKKCLFLDLVHIRLSLDPAFIELLRPVADAKSWVFKKQGLLSGFLENFPDINAIRVKLPGSDVSMPLLSAAICLENNHAACFLIRLKSNTNEKDSMGRTPLMHTCAKGRVSMFNLLRYNDFCPADIEARDNDGKIAMMFLHEGSFHEDEMILDFFIRNLASTISIRDLDGKTAFFYLMKSYPNVFLRNLDKFTDPTTRKKFVLEALTFDDPEKAVYELISKGCGVIDGELSSTIRHEIAARKLKKKDLEFSKNIDRCVEDGLTAFLKTQQKEVKSDE